MARPKKDDRLIRHTVMVPPNTKAALVAAGAEEVREMLGAVLPPPAPMQVVLVAMEVDQSYRIESLIKATGLAPGSIRGALGTLCRTRQVVKGPEGFVRMF